MQVLAEVILQGTSGMPEDQIVNTFPFDLPEWADDAVDGAALYTILVGAYNNDLADAHDLAYWLSPWLLRTSNQLKVNIYDITTHLDGSPHGGPIYSAATALDASSGGRGLPEEVALVMTTRAEGYEFVSTEIDPDLEGPLPPFRPRQRYTGRNYFGPWNLDAVSGVGVGGRWLPTDEVIEHLLSIGEYLQLQAAGEWATGAWCVWSRADEALRPIGRVQVDNAWDTQRRRGAAPTVRSSRDI